MTDVSSNLDVDKFDGPRRRTIVSLVIPNNEGNRRQTHFSTSSSTSWKQKKRHRDTITMVTRLLSGVYAILIVLFGIMFPVSEALHEQYWLQSMYTGIFLVYIYSVSTVFLLYLQIYIIPASNRKLRAKEKQLYSQSQHKRSESLSTSSQKWQPQLSSVTELNNNTEDSPPDNWMRKSSLNTTSPTDNLMRKSSFNTTNIDLNRKPSTLHRGSIAVVNEDEEGQTMSWIGLADLKELFSHEGSSFYLRLGTLVFGIGNLIYIGLELDYHMIGVPENCETAKFGWTYIFRLIFTLVQTFFLFKHSKIDITVHVTVAQFGFLHLIATNLCLWIRTLINEIMEAFHHSHEDDELITTTISAVPTLSLDQNPPRMFVDSVPSNCSIERELLTAFSPYLFPFVLEYSLIAVGIFAIMGSNLGNSHHSNLMQNINHVMKTRDAKQQKAIRKNVNLEEDPTEHRHGPMHGHTHHSGISLESSHKGMFIGILLLTGIIVSMILFIYDQNNNELDGAQLNYLIADLCLHSCILVANIMTAYSLSKMKFSVSPLSVDDTLLLVSMSGSFIFELSIIVSTGVYLNEEKVSGDQKTFTILSMVCSVVAATQTVAQTILLIAGLRCYSEIGEKNKYGREAVTFLIVANVTAWIFRTVQVKELELGIQDEFYGTLAWLFILNLNLPLLLFFRFHSSVCFADIWSEAYEPVDHQSVISNEPPPGMGVQNVTSPPMSPILMNGGIMNDSVMNGSVNNGFFIGDESSSLAEENIQHADDVTVHL